MLPTISYLENMTPAELCQAIITKLNDKAYKEVVSSYEDSNEELQKFKTYLNQKLSTQWIRQLKKDLDNNPS